MADYAYIYTTKCCFDKLLWMLFDCDCKSWLDIVSFCYHPLSVGCLFFFFVCAFFSRRWIRFVSEKNSFSIGEIYFSIVSLRRHTKREHMIQRTTSRRLVCDEIVSYSLANHNFAPVSERGWKFTTEIITRQRASLWTTRKTWHNSIIIALRTLHCCRTRVVKIVYIGNKRSFIVCFSKVVWFMGKQFRLQNFEKKFFLSKN